MTRDSLREAPAPTSQGRTRFDIRLVIESETLRRLLIGGIVLITLAGLGAEIFDHLEFDDPYYLIAFFGLSYEENLPTWYTSILLFSSAVTLTFISILVRQRQEPYRVHWWGLAFVFYLISLDEIAQYHEEISNFFDYDGVLYFGWVIPATIFVAIFALSYLRFLLHLPRPLATRMTLAGAIYVTGALAMELPLGYWTDLEGKENLTYGLIDLVEESLEIVGVSLFLHTLLSHLAAITGGEQPAPETSEPSEPVQS